MKKQENKLNEIKREELWIPKLFEKLPWAFPTLIAGILVALFFVQGLLDGSLSRNPEVSVGYYQVLQFNEFSNFVEARAEEGCGRVVVGQVGAECGQNYFRGAKWLVINEGNCIWLSAGRGIGYHQDCLYRR